MILSLNKQCNLNRERFIADTGVYVTPSYFDGVRTDYLYYMEYNNMTEEKALAEYPQYWLTEYAYAIVELKNNKFKFCYHDIEIANDWSGSEDGDDSIQLNDLDLEDIIERCSSYAFQWQEAFYKQYSLICKLKNDGKINGDVADILINSSYDIEERLCDI